MIGNTGKLAGRVLMISGASRGIGKAIAVKAAQDGAKVVIAAKTAEPHPKLPGTIYSAAKEIEAAGGEALPCIVDVRDEKSIQDSIDSAVAKFGGIDILINNASAISLTGTQFTDMKKYDLMHQINTRGTYLMSKLCIPHLLKGTNPHILNISPPLNMNPRWFKDHVAYTMAKYGMSMCVLGMHEEFRDAGIAVNALWPRTAIITAAMEMLGGKDISAECRTPEIMADAAYVMLGRDSRSYTGHFAVDDDVLAEEGVKNFDVYAVDPKVKPMPDFFLDEFIDAASEKTGTAASSKGDTDQLAAVFDKISAMISPEIVTKNNSAYDFNIKMADGEVQAWFLDLKSEEGGCGKGTAPVKADCTFALPIDVFLRMFSGDLKPTAAFMQGKMKLKGDASKALRLETLMKSMNEKPEAPKEAPKDAEPKSAEIAGLEKVFDKVRGLITPELRQKNDAVYAFKVTLPGETEPSRWYIDLKSEEAGCGQGKAPVSPDVTFTMPLDVFHGLFNGEIKATSAFMMGKMKLAGDMSKALKLETLMKKMLKSKL